MDMFKRKKLFIIFLIILITILLCSSALLLISGCNRVLYIPGASFGYYIWGDENKIFIEWSADRKDNNFEGVILTDGKITDYKLKNWEENDIISFIKTINSNNSNAENENNDDTDKNTTNFENNYYNKIKFSSYLNKEDFSDGISFTLQNYTYIDFDLKINGNYDLSRINVGGFLENPKNNVFRIEKGYFEKIKEKPFYKKHPFEEFFNKLYVNKSFTFIFLFIIGVIIIEILRITAFSSKNKKYIWVLASYIILIIIIFLIYILIRFFTSSS